jgi:outer membrane protein assembly factor BamB
MRKNSTHVLLTIASLVLFSVACGRASAEDWPQWRGPNRDGVSAETGLLKSWPAGGPKMLWKATGLGSGFSTPSIAKGKIFLLGTLDKGKEEHLIALDAKDGKQLWATAIGHMAGGHAGPRSTPTVDGNVAYVISSDGQLVCADVAKGQIIWHKDLKSDFAGKNGSWAYAESPLIDGDTLVCTPGGSDATLVALDKKTGAVKWKSSIPNDLKTGGKRSYDTAGYSSVVVGNINGVRQYAQFLDGGVVGVAAEDGAFLWHYDEPANGTANCSTPIIHDNAVFAASAYGNGGGRANIASAGGKWEAHQQYFIKSLQNHHGGLVLVDGYVYGTGSNTLLCVNFKTGDIAWQERSVGKGSISYADGRLYVRSENGPIALVEANPKEYKEVGRFDQPDRSSEKSWPYPVVANGRLYLRDWDNMFCYDVSAK